MNNSSIICLSLVGIFNLPKFKKNILFKDFISLHMLDTNNSTKLVIFSKFLILTKMIFFTVFQLTSVYNFILKLSVFFNFSSLSRKTFMLGFLKSV
jgi:hypothetical protein